MIRRLPAMLLLLPGAAMALGEVANAEGSSSSILPGHLAEGALVFFTCLLVFLSPLGLNWGAQALWKKVFKTAPPFAFFSVAAMELSVLLVFAALSGISAFEQLFSAFADLPASTRFVLHYRYLLIVPLFGLLFLLCKLKSHPGRERYFAAILAGELLVLVLCISALYAPIFRVGVTAA